MEIKGTVKEIYQEQVISDKFKKREFVVTDNSSQYPQDLLIQCTNDKCDLLDKIKVGAYVRVHINLRGRGWTSPKDGITKYFNTIEGWKIDFNEQEEPAVENKSDKDDDDLPF